MIVVLEYRAPVWVTVDTEQGTVERVVVGDEALDGPTFDASTTETGRAVGRRSFEKARRIAEGAYWPTWSAGW